MGTHLERRTLRYLYGPDPWIAGDDQILAYHVARFADDASLDNYLLFPTRTVEDVVDLSTDGQPTDITDLAAPTCDALFASAERPAQWQITAAEQLQTGGGDKSAKAYATRALWEAGYTQSQIASRMDSSTTEVGELLVNEFDIGI